MKRGSLRRTHPGTPSRIPTDPPEEKFCGSPITLRLLLFGLAAGIVCAAVGLFSQARDRTADLIRGNVAVVNGHPILRSEFSRALGALASDRGGSMSDAEASALLERMIDEELLVQRGVALGLLEHDRRIRGELTSAVIDGVVGQAQTEAPDEAALRVFYQGNRDLFASSGRIRVRQLFIAADGSDPRQKAATAVERLRQGEAFDAVREVLGDAEAVPVPDALVPPTKLAEYLGPVVVRALADAEAGTVVDPIVSSAGYHVVQVREREPAYVPPFEEIRDQVRDEFQRRAGDQALEDYLERLRADADIVVAEEVP